MKKLTVFLSLLFCISFADMFAESHNVRYEVSGYAWMQIRVNGVLVIDTAVDNPSGNFPVEEGQTVDVLAGSAYLNHPLDPIISEDDPNVIPWAATNDYNFINEEHSSLQESFVMNVMDMFISMRS